jgi:hypothetical protein
MESDNILGLDIKPLGRGHNPDPQLIALVLRLFAHLKKERSSASSVSTLRAQARIIAYTGLSQKFITHIWAEFIRTKEIPQLIPLNRGQRCSDCPIYVQRTDLIAIRHIINDMNAQGRAVTLAKLEKITSEQIQKQLSQRQLRYILREKLGYEWHRTNKHDQAKYTPKLHSWINDFIRRKLVNRNSNTPLLEVYIDESYLNEHHAANFSWFPKTDQPHRHVIGAPSGKGRRIILITMEMLMVNYFYNGLPIYVSN